MRGSPPSCPRATPRFWVSSAGLKIDIAASSPTGWGGVWRLGDALAMHTGLNIHMALGGVKGNAGIEAVSDSLAKHGGLRMHLAMGGRVDGNAGPRAVAESLASRVSRDDLHLRILLSYHYYKEQNLDDLFAKHFAPPYPEVFLDSGAYSAESQGASIDIGAYGAFIHRYRHLLTTYANLDVIRNADATQANQDVLEGLGLHPLPVFHFGSHFSHLERLIERYPYIALGGLVGKIGGAKPWLVRCFKLSGGRSVFHGFGVTTWEVIRDFRWYSVDSSSWTQGLRFGTVPIFDERRGTFVKARLGVGAEWAKHAAVVRSLGFDPHDFADRRRNDRFKVCAISALSYMLAERWLRQRHGPVIMPTRESPSTGPMIHLAQGAEHDLPPLAGLVNHDKELRRAESVVIRP